MVWGQRGPAEECSRSEIQLLKPVTLTPSPPPKLSELDKENQLCISWMKSFRILNVLFSLSKRSAETFFLKNLSFESNKSQMPPSGSWYRRLFYLLSVVVAQFRAVFYWSGGSSSRGNWTEWSRTPSPSLHSQFLSLFAPAPALLIHFALKPAYTDHHSLKFVPTLHHCNFSLQWKFECKSLCSFSFPQATKK